MFKQDRQNGQFYADNVLDYYLAFEDAQTWTASSGTGTGVLDNTKSFYGNNSLKIENTAPTTDLEITNSTQSTDIKIGGTYQLSVFLRKDDAAVAYSGHIEIFKNASTYNTQPFTLGSDNSDEDNPDINDKWVRFVCDVPLEFVKSDIVTIKIQLDGIVGYADPSTVLWVDGLMLNINERQNAMPPQYTPPTSKLAYKVQDASGQPVINEDTFTTWMADANGTLDGTVYEEGDILVTVNSNGSQKTVILADFSAL